MRAVAVAAVAFAAAWFVTWCYRRWALRVGRIDVPGARSSHAVATPTGGGAGIVAGCLAALAAAFALGDVRGDWLLVFGLALGMAALGHADDRRALPVLPRLLGQCGAAAAVMLCALAESGQGSGAAGLALLAIGLLALVWLVNAFNFMDGIDGLAASQAAFMAGAAAWLLAQDAGLNDSVLLLAGVAAAALGFLVLNWPPARIFMGDTGSQPLGLLLGAAGAVTVARGELSLAVWAILWAAFLADATLTLLHRAWRGEPLMQAHRDHAYQRLARRRGAHRPVTLGAIALNLCWLLPLALLAHRVPRFGPFLALLAYVPPCLGVVLAWRGDARGPAAPPGRSVK